MGLVNGKSQVRGEYIMPLPGIIFKSKSGSRSSGTPEKPRRQSRGDKCTAERVGYGTQRKLILRQREDESKTEECASQQQHAPQDILILFVISKQDFESFFSDNRQKGAVRNVACRAGVSTLITRRQTSVSLRLVLTWFLGENWSNRSRGRVLKTAESSLFRLRRTYFSERNICLLDLKTWRNQLRLET